MKNHLLLTVFVYLFLQGCTPVWKSSLSPNGNLPKQAIENAIIDFYNTSQLVDQDSSFSVNYKNINSEIIGIGILGSRGRFTVTEDGKKSRIPTRYIEYENNLFYWYEKDYPLNESTINKLNEYNLIDSVNTIAEAIFVNDDAQGGIVYYFCKNNLQKYKKIETNTAKKYKRPRLRFCK